MRETFKTRDEAVFGARALATCLKDEADEDAFSWAIDILEWLHTQTKRRLAKAEESARHILGDGHE